MKRAQLTFRYDAQTGRCLDPRLKPSPGPYWSTYSELHVVVVGDSSSGECASALAAAALIIHAAFCDSDDVNVRARGAHPHRFSIVGRVAGVRHLGVDGAPVVQSRLDAHLALRLGARQFLDELRKGTVLRSDNAAKCDAVAFARRARAVVCNALAPGVKV